MISTLMTSISDETVWIKFSSLVCKQLSNDMDAPIAFLRSPIKTKNNLREDEDNSSSEPFRLQRSKSTLQSLV